MKKAAIVLLLLTYASTATAIPRKMKRNEKDAAVPGIYHEITLEDFTTMPFSNSDTSSAKLYLAYDYPAPIVKAGNYLVVEIQSTGEDALQVTFEKQPTLKQHARTLTLWVFATNLPGDLLLLIKDTQGNPHLLNFGKLNFRGWHHLSTVLPNHIVQRDIVPGTPSLLQVMKLIYRPGPTQRLKKNQIFFIDSLGAQVREKYLLP